MRLPPAVARLLPAPLPTGAGLWPRRGAARPPDQVENKTKGKLQKQICQVVLDHFEKQYTTELGDKWTSVRDVLTCPSCWQYAILLNKFSQSAELEDMLRVEGYHPAFQGTLPYLPRSLKCYISRTPRRFPAQKHQTGKLKEYYLLNAASVLPVLALEVKDGEDVLDLCAAPGGKSVAILQCAYPGQFHCNEYDDLRSRWLKQTIESFIPDPLVNLIAVSKLDGRQIGDFKPELYDKTPKRDFTYQGEPRRTKSCTGFARPQESLFEAYCTFVHELDDDTHLVLVLVDAPCSNDRSWLFSSDTQQATLRLIQRKELSSLQFQLLRSAIKALRPGGSLVYSTCTLSKAENSDVINLILKSCANVLPVDISEMAKAISQEFTFLSDTQQHELLVLPEKGKAWGPMYVAKLKKI